MGLPLFMGSMFINIFIDVKTSNKFETVVEDPGLLVQC